MGDRIKERGKEEFEGDSEFDKIYNNLLLLRNVMIMSL